MPTSLISLKTLIKLYLIEQQDESRCGRGFFLFSSSNIKLKNPTVAFGKVRSGARLRSPEPRCRFLIRSRFIRRNGGKIANGDRKNEELGPIVSRLIGRREISRRNGRSGYFAVRPSGGAVNFHFRSSWDQYLLDRKLWLVSTYVSYYVSVPVPSIDVTIGFICSRNN